jgi:DnaJ-class molecular chaperone
MVKDYYKILGLHHTATAEEIKTAYRKLAHIWHPDKSKSPNAHEKFIEIKEAYTVLSSPEQRRIYDNIYQVQFSAIQIKTPSPRYEYEKKEFEEWVKKERVKIELDLLKAVDNTFIEIFAFIEKAMPFIAIIVLIIWLIYTFK